MRILIALTTIGCLTMSATPSAVSAEAALWKVGLASAKITPDKPVFTAGYSSRNKPFEKVEHDIWAKALVIEDTGGQRAVIVTSDILGFPASVAEPICERVREKTGLKREQILLNSAHTHTGPVIGLEQARVSSTSMSPEDAARTVEYTKTLIDKVADCIIRANEKLVPANLSWGVGIESFVMNRREHTPNGVILGVNPSGPVDRSVPVLRVDSPDGKPLAVLFQAACHNTTLGPNNYELCGDYAGFAQYELQEQMPGVQAMFMLGCAGDSNPYPRTGMDDARMHGATLGKEVSRVLGTKLKPVRGPLKVAFDRANLPLQQFTREELEKRATIRGLFGDLSKRMLESLDKGEKLPTQYSAPLAVMQFGDDLTLVGLSGEVVVDYVYFLQKALGPLNLWVAAYCNDVFGYVPSARVLEEGGYETRGIYSGALGFFTPSAQEVIVAKVRELAGKVGRAMPSTLTPSTSIRAGPGPSPARIGSTSTQPAQAGEGGRGEGLPKVVLIGDSIRMGYAPLVAERLKGKATVISSTENAADTGNLLKHLDEWVIKEKPALVHLNCGLHDLKLDKQTKKHQVELPQYETHLKEIVTRVRGCGAALVFATTTPISDERHAKRGANFDRTDADVRRYNEVAMRVMREAGVTVHDLNYLVKANGDDTLLLGDGTHYTPRGYALLADAVTDCINRQLSVLNYKHGAPVASGPAAAQAYRADEARRDALTPPQFKQLQIGKFEPPASPADWKKQRPDVQRKVVASLGDLPPRPNPQKVRIVSRELRPGYMLERVAIDNGAQSEVTALLLIPHRREGEAAAAPTPSPALPPGGGGGRSSGPGASFSRTRRPAVLWLHSSTPDKNQVITPNTNGGEDSLGEALVKKGYVVMAPDAWWHGDRAGTGPAGMAEPTYGDEQNSLHKLNLWLGRTLWGMFVRDDQIALDYLCSRPEVDAKHIGATGMSMGSTRAWWLAAVDDRVTATVAMACLTRYENLINHGQLRQHGVYYFTNGLLKHFDSEGVISLIAPRAALFLTGELDAGSPADGVREIEKQVSRVYGTLGATDRFRNVLYPETGHTVTPEMRREMMEWFDRWLKAK